MKRLLTNIFVSIFVPKSKRANVKHYLLGIPNLLRVYRKAKNVGKNLHCSEGFVSVNKNTIIGSGVHINGLIVSGNGSLKIGNYCHFGQETLIITDNHNYEGSAIPYDQTVTSKNTIIEDFVWCGARVTILPGTKIGKGAIIQAGAVVHGEIPSCAIAGGNPAQIFKFRNKEHFKELEQQQKYY